MIAFHFRYNFVKKKTFTLLGVPEVLLEKYDKKEDGSVWFTMTIKSVPVPHAVQWCMMGNNSETFEPINVNAAEYKGTLNTFPHPVLVIKHVEKMENYSFEIEVKNLIGKVKKKIQGNKELFKNVPFINVKLLNAHVCHNNRPIYSNQTTQEKSGEIICVSFKQFMYSF